MTKRASPFEPFVCRQLKVHLNNYENDFNAIKKVEEQTIRKLIEGSKNMKPHIIQTSNFEYPFQNFEIQDRNKNLMQKCVTNYFTLNGKLTNEKSKFITANDMSNKCFFCDSRTNCTYQCVKCSEFYCSACSFVKTNHLKAKHRVESLLHPSH